MTRNCDLCGKPDSFNVHEAWLCDGHSDELCAAPLFDVTKKLHEENKQLRRDLGRLRYAVEMAGYEECASCGCLFQGGGPKCSGDRCATYDELATARGQDPDLCRREVTP